MSVRNRVLVIDDDPDYADFIEASLQPYAGRYQIDCVAGFQQGLSAIRDNQHDIYLVDQNLDSGHTGMDLINETSSRLRPLVLITGGNNDGVGDEAVRGGACDFILKKHINGESLDRTLRNSLNRSKRMMALIERQQELQKQLSRDPLTGLSSRVALKGLIEDRLKIEQLSSAMLYLDLDGFKEVNDQLGHSVGDELLQRVARRLIKSVRPDDIVGRLGGDEFLIFFSTEVGGVPIAEIANKVASSIISALAEAFLIGQASVSKGKFIHISASIGIALAPTDSKDYQQLIHLSDRAMYRAKNRGRNGYVFYHNAFS